MSPARRPWSLVLGGALVAAGLSTAAARGQDATLADLEQVTSAAAAKAAAAVVRVIVPEVTPRQRDESSRADRRRRRREARENQPDESAEKPATPEAESQSPPAAPPPNQQGEPPEPPTAPADSNDSKQPGPESAGKPRVRTGLLVSSDGCIVTSLVNLGDQSEGIKVELADGRTFDAKRLGQDLQRDVVLLKINAKDLPSPETAAKSDLAIGQWVLALGRTLPTPHPTVHKGIISAMGRLSGVAIQTDANVSAVNYGGPLVDLRGRVVAMIASVGRTGSTARADLFSDSGIGFAIPIEDILAELPELKKGRRFDVPFLGIEFNLMRLGSGAEVVRVVPATAAAESGIKEGDIIVDFEGVTIDSPFQLFHQIGSRRVGDKVTFTVRRGEQTLTLSGKLKARPAGLPE